MPALVAEHEEQLRAFLDPLLALPDLRIILSGAGSSAYVGEVLAPSLTSALGRKVDSVATTDLVSNPHDAFAIEVPTLLVSFARSGDSPESSAATRLADQCLASVYHLVVTCDGGGRLAREHAEKERSFVLLMPRETNDRGFAMTSSFTSMLLATWLMLCPSPASDGALVGRLASAAEQVLDHSDLIASVAAKTYDRVIFLGSGPLIGLARESALKMLELTGGRVGSWFDTALGFRHGPKALLDDRTLAVVFQSNDEYTSLYDKDIAAELQRSLGPDRVAVVTAEETATDLPAGEPTPAFRLRGLTGVNDALLTLPFVLIAQLLALRMSVALGLTPDNPFPDGEVNRVVQGVTIHPLSA